MIPRPIAAHVAKLFDKLYSRSSFTNLFNMSGTHIQSPGGNKIDEVTDWLLLIGREEPDDALRVLGALLEDFMEVSTYGDDLTDERASLRRTMERYGLRYVDGGTIISVHSGGATKTLASLLADKKNFPAVIAEFERATANVELQPREAASAAANILEAICKEYIIQHPLTEMPAKQDLSKVFDVVRKDLGFDPSLIEDKDLKTILSGLLATVDGIAALRTHASSAHAQGTSKRQYRLAPRHARLAVHAAHAIVAFILETWTEREKNNVLSGFS